MKSDMTEGSIEGHLTRFAVPLILGNMFQLTYNAADSIIVGVCSWKWGRLPCLEECLVLPVAV